MKIEALEDIKSHGYVITQGDVITVADDAGAAWCSYGWARDVAEQVLTGPRVVLNATMQVDSLGISHVGTEAK